MGAVLLVLGAEQRCQLLSGDRAAEPSNPSRPRRGTAAKRPGSTGGARQRVAPARPDSRAFSPQVLDPQHVVERHVATLALKLLRRLASQPMTARP